MCFCFFSCAHFRLRTYTLTDPQHPSYTIFSYVLVSFDVAIRAGQLTRRPLVLTRNSNICNAGACLTRISIFGRRLDPQHPSYTIYSYVLASFDIATRAGQLTRHPLVLTRNSNICHAGTCLARISIFGRRLNQHHHAFSLYYNTSILYVQHPRSGRSSNYATHSPIHS